jgi:hypothetical protein
VARESGAALAVFVFGWCAAVLARVGWIDAAGLARAETQAADTDVLTSPGPALLQGVAFEHPLAWADLTWLGIVQEIGRAKSLSEAAWDRVERWSAIATDLDPKYYTVYHSTAVNLTIHAHRLEASDRILLKASKALPARWEFPFLLGYNAYFFHGDGILASDYLVEASKLPNAPAFLAPLSGRMRYHGGDEAGAIALLEMLMETLDGPAREDVKERLLVLKSEPRLRAYDAACLRHRGATGQQPTPQQLFEQGAVHEEPKDLLGFDLRFDEKCIARSQMIRIREAEARKRVGSGGTSNELEVRPIDRSSEGAP